MKRCILVIITIAGFTAMHAGAQTLSVGDKAPDVKVYSWIKGKPIEKFKKGKAYVVEFGATWCVPCAAMIPKLSALADQYPDDLEVTGMFVMERFVGIAKDGTPNYVNKVKEYVKKQDKNIRYNVAVDDTTEWMAKNWLTAAGKDGIPYSFVIDKNGNIAWIGTGDQIAQAVSIVLNKEYQLEEAIVWNKKQYASKTKYDETELLLIDGNGGNEKEFEYRSVLTKYKGDFKTGQHLFVQSYRWAAPGSKEEKFQGKIQEIGASISHLYYMAYGDTMWNFPNSRKYNFATSYGRYWPEPIIHVADSSVFVTTSASPLNKFNYSLKVPLQKASAQFLQETMRRDLQTYFGYTATVEKRMMPCWKLTATAEAKKQLKTKSPGKEYSENFDKSTGYEAKNGNIRGIIFVIWAYGQKQKGIPVIDETGITDEIDFRLAADLEDFESIKKGLSEIGLHLVKGEKEMNVVVIRDASNSF